LKRAIVLRIASLAAVAGAYALVAGRAGRPDVIPPVPQIAEAFADLISGGYRQPAAAEQIPAAEQPAATEMPAGHHHHHSSEQVETLLQEGVTLQASLGITALRVLFGLVVGVPLGILIGLWMGWSRRADDYLHPIYVLLRSVPPLALITYVMLWLGHSEAHRLIPIVYAVATTMVIPAYHGVRDVAARYVIAAQSLGAQGRLLLGKVVLPAAGPDLLAGFRYSLAVAWMTAVGAEMLMAENGMGNLLVGGGLWSSRLQTRSDPAVIIVGIAALALAGWVMDGAVKLAGARVTRWAR